MSRLKERVWIFYMITVMKTITCFTVSQSLPVELMLSLCFCDKSQRSCHPQGCECESIPSVSSHMWNMNRCVVMEEAAVRTHNNRLCSVDLQMTLNNLIIYIRLV